MKRQNFFLMAVASAIIASGCDGDPVQPTSTVDMSDVQSAIGLTSITEDIDALLRFSVTKIYDEQGSATSAEVSAVAQGIFTDDSTLTDVGQVSLNSQQFEHDELGFYSHMSPDVPVNGTLSWAVTDYRDSNLTRSVPMAGPLDITGLKAGDTISKAAGFTVNYTGYNSGTIEASINIDDAFTYLWIHPDSVIVGGEQPVEVDEADDGSISFLPAALQGLTVGRIYVVSLRQSRWNIDSSLVHSKVGIYSSYQAQVPIYLAP